MYKTRVGVQNSGTGRTSYMPLNLVFTFMLGSLTSFRNDPCFPYIGHKGNLNQAVANLKHNTCFLILMLNIKLDKIG